MIGRLLRGGFMTAIYAYLYIPIIILIVNSFNSSRFGINWQGFIKPPRSSRPIIPAPPSYSEGVMFSEP